MTSEEPIAPGREPPAGGAAGRESMLAGLRRKIAANWLQMFSGHMVASLLTLVSFILMSRALSVELVGIIAIVQTYWRIVGGLLSFQSFKVLISYGAEAVAAGDRRRFMGIVRTCVSADATIALLALGVGLLLLWQLGRAMNIPPQFDMLAMFAGAMVLNVATSAYSGVLRLFDRFYLVAGVEVVTATIRVVAAIIGFVQQLPAEFFLASWVVAQIVGDLTLIGLGLLTLRNEGYGGWIRESLPKETPTLLKSLLAVNGSTTAKFLTEEGDVLLVNAFLGAAGAGSYRVAKNLAAVIYRFTGPLINVIYPEIARLIAAGDKRAYMRITTEINLAGGAMALAALGLWWLFGHLILEYTVGPQYAHTYHAVLLFMAALSVSLFGLCCLPTLFAMQKWRAAFLITLAAAVSFFASASVLIPQYGINGAAAAQVIGFAVEVALSMLVIRRALELRQWAEAR